MAATLRTLLALTVCASFSSAASAQTVVDSIFTGQVSRSYSDPNNWSPPDVPNNSNARYYNVTVSARVDVDMHARISNLTANGIVISNGASLVVSETATISSSPPPEGSYFAPGVTLEGGIFVVEGTLTNFDASTRTLRGGAFRLAAPPEAGGGASILRFRGADIVHNASSIQLSGPLVQILDENGLNALRNFASNATDGEFSVSGADFGTAGDFINAGTLRVFADFTVNGSLTNFDPVSRTLAGGTYVIGDPGSLRFAGADIVTNAASLTLLRRELAITDLNGNDALRNFAFNDAAGRLEFISSFTTSGTFTNAGEITIYGGASSGTGVFTVRRGHRYIQTSGSTLLNSCLFQGDVEINGGTLADRYSHTLMTYSNIDGNLAVGDALFAPDHLRVRGSVRLSAGTRYRVVALVNPGINPSRPPLFVDGPADIAGTIEIEEPGLFPTASDSLATALGSKGLTGAFSNARNGVRVLATSGRGSYVVTYNDDAVLLGDYQRNPPAAQLLNISTRAEVGTGGNVTIAGFIIYGDEGKKVALRGIGPSLGKSGVTAVLDDPVLELHDARGNIIARNDSWKETQADDIQASGLAPGDEGEAAMIVTLPPGPYTVVLRGNRQTGGVGLVEVYDLQRDSHSKLANLSTRGFVDAENPLIGGYISGGDGEGKTELTVRAIGPGLAQRRVPNWLPDPALEVRDKNGGLVAENDDWRTPETNYDVFLPGLTPDTGRDATTGIIVPRGEYTVVVRGKAGASGVALVEIYDHNR